MPRRDKLSVELEANRVMLAICWLQPHPDLGVLTLEATDEQIAKAGGLSPAAARRGLKHLALKGEITVFHLNVGPDPQAIVVTREECECFLQLYPLYFGGKVRFGTPWARAIVAEVTETP
jgi:hypothetical protein